MGSWVEDETAACGLGDARLNRRLGAMLASMGERPGKSLPTAFQDWANTKAAYRFFSNEKVSEDRILAGHFQASALRVQATDGPILVLQDTTEFSFQRAAPEKIGFTKTSTGRKETGPPWRRTGSRNGSRGPEPPNRSGKPMQGKKRNGCVLQ